MLCRRLCALHEIRCTCLLRGQHTAEGNVAVIHKIPGLALVQLGSEGAARQLGSGCLGSQPLQLARARALQPVQPFRSRHRVRVPPSAYTCLCRFDGRATSSCKQLGLQPPMALLPKGPLQPTALCSVHDIHARNKREEQARAFSCRQKPAHRQAACHAWTAGKCSRAVARPRAPPSPPSTAPTASAAGLRAAQASQRPLPAPDQGIVTGPVCSQRLAAHQHERPHHVGSLCKAQHMMRAGNQWWQGSMAASRHELGCRSQDCPHLRFRQLHPCLRPAWLPLWAEIVAWRRQRVCTSRLLVLIISLPGVCCTAACIEAPSHAMRDTDAGRSSARRRAGAAAIWIAGPA